MKNNKIDPKGWYTLLDIARSGMFPWANSFWSVRRIVELDRGSKNILKANVTGTGRGTKYHFRGSNINKFVEAFESGKVRL